MAQYFETFPKFLYDIDNTKNYKLVADIFRRIKIRESLKDILKKQSNRIW